MRIRKLVQASTLPLAIGLVFATTAALPAHAEGNGKQNKAPETAVVDKNQYMSNQRLIDLDQLTKAVNADGDHNAGYTTDGDDHVTVHKLPAVPLSDEITSLESKLQRDGAQVMEDVQPNSLQTLTNSFQLVRAAVQSGSLSGVTGIEIDYDRNSVRVETLGSAADIVGRLSAYTSVAYAVTGGTSSFVSDRYNDSSPWYFGDLIYTPIPGGTINCTSGFMMYNASHTPYAITAGHCFALGTSITASQQAFGSVKFRRVQNSGDYDNELIAGNTTYAPVVWAGAAGQGTPPPAKPLYVSGSFDSCNGCRVYFDGQVTGESLATVMGSPQCRTVDQYFLCGQQEVQATNGQTLCQAGDSGGPVYAYDGTGRLTAVGIISSRRAPSTTDCFYTPLPAVLQYWQGTIATGP